MAENAASSGLFAVFLLSIYSLFLIPYTIYRFCSAGEDVTTQPVVKVSSCCWFRCSPLCSNLLLTHQQAVPRAEAFSKATYVPLKPRMLYPLPCSLQSKRKPVFADRVNALCTKRKHGSCFCPALCWLIRTC
jgi:hypothetical protein